MRSLATAVLLLLLAESAVASVYLKRDRQPKEAGAFAKQTAVEEKPKKDDGKLFKASNDWFYAVDLVGSVSSNMFSCLKSNGVSTVFARIYSGSNGGQSDTSGVQNAITAYNNGLNIEVFIQPSPSSSKTGGQQFNEAYNYATGQGLRLSRVWLVVHSPIDWGSYTPSGRRGKIAHFTARRASVQKAKMSGGRGRGQVVLWPKALAFRHAQQSRIMSTCAKTGRNRKSEVDSTRRLASDV